MIQPQIERWPWLYNLKTFQRLRTVVTDDYDFHTRDDNNVDDKKLLPVILDIGACVRYRAQNIPHSRTQCTRIQQGRRLTTTIIVIIITIIIINNNVYNGGRSIFFD